MSASSSAASLKPAALTLGVIGIFLFLALRVAFPPAESVRPSQTPRLITRTASLTPSNTPTPSITPTVTRTPRPTRTLRSSETPSATPTFTATSTPPLPTYPPIPTLASPAQSSSQYLLADWTPERADAVIQILQGWPDSQFPAAKRRSAEYNAAFAYAAYAQREALLRFPAAAQAETWRWGLAYTFTRLNDPRAAQIYADRIAAALANGQTSPEALPAWFAARERRLSLGLLQTTDGYLVQISNDGGAIFLWLTGKPEDPRLTPLAARFDYTAGLRALSALGDLTGDDLPEAALSYTTHRETRPVPVQVFDLAGLAELPLQATLPLDFAASAETNWSILNRELRQTITLFPACEVTVSQTFRWDGKKLGFVEMSPYRVNLNPENLAQCEALLAHAEQHWPPWGIQTIVESLIPQWPAEGRPALRYTLGLAYALDNRYDLARQTLADLPQAEDFLAAYTSPVELYRACQQTQDCNLRRAFQGLAALSGVDDPTAAVAFLQENGVSTRSSGIFDFDLDGIAERWMVIRPRPQQALEFWILTASPQGMQALFFGVIEDGSPQPYYHEPISAPPIVQLARGSGLRLQRAADGAPYIETVMVSFLPNDETLRALNAAQEALLSGADPGAALAQLTAAEQSPRFNCQSYQICDRFWYTLGLAAEWDGNQPEAIRAYFKLWWDHLRSPFTLMARFKMIQLTP